MHIIVEPVESRWKEEGIELAKQLMGQKKEARRPGVMDTGLSALNRLGQEVLFGLFGGEPGEAPRPEREEKAVLSPGLKKTVEAVEEKIAKIGFKSKIRILYAAKISVYNPSRCIEGFIGAINQFHEQNRNALVPYMNTRAHYDRSGRKSFKLKNSFVKHFKKRKLRWKKCGGYILNIEELATLWHFPLPFVKTPLLQKAGPKRGEPPSGLPMEATEIPLRRLPAAGLAPEPPPPPPPPEELPYG